MNITTSTFGPWRQSNYKKLHDKLNPSISLQEGLHRKVRRCQNQSKKWAQYQNSLLKKTTLSKTVQLESLRVSKQFTNDTLQKLSGLNKMASDIFAKRPKIKHQKRSLKQLVAIKECADSSSDRLSSRKEVTQMPTIMGEQMFRTGLLQKTRKGGFYFGYSFFPCKKSKKC